MKKYEPTFKSLRNYECPDWFLDAKFGIWSHWGPQSVPRCGDWYAKQMYIQDSFQYLHHVRTYGHPSKFGHKDICKLWKAEKFDPDYLMEKYYKAGARYFVAQAMHHDHFFNYNSDINPMNSTQVGPMKDIVGMWKKSAEKFSLPFGITEHLSASFRWWFVNKGYDKHGPYKGVPYDGNDPKYRDFYFDNYEHATKEYLDNPMSSLEDTIENWYTKNPKFHNYWLDVMKEIIDKYEPDLLYTDGGLPFARQIFDVNGAQPADENNPLYKNGLEAVAYYYNKSIEKFGKNNFIYTQKDRRPEVYKIGILDIERSQLPDIRPYPWQTDTCIGAWFYSDTQVYKKPKHIIEMLIDIIAKNGTMLLNIPQLPDGSIDYEAEYILDELAKWFNTCSEGVYSTRPWKVSGEGNNQVNTDLFKEDAVQWDSSDVRFTQKDNTVYAFLLNPSENRVSVIHSFADERVKNVSLLGFGKVEFNHSYGILTVKLPQELPTEYANCLSIEI